MSPLHFLFSLSLSIYVCCVSLCTPRQVWYNNWYQTDKLLTNDMGATETVKVSAHCLDLFAECLKDQQRRQVNDSQLLVVCERIFARLMAAPAVMRATAEYPGVVSAAVSLLLIKFGAREGRIPEIETRLDMVVLLGCCWLLMGCFFFSFVLFPVHTKNTLNTA